MNNIKEISKQLKSEGVNHVRIKIDEKGNGWVIPETESFSAGMYAILDYKASYEIPNKYLDLQNVMKMVGENQDSNEMIVIYSVAGRSIHGEIYKAVKVIN